MIKPQKQCHECHCDEKKINNVIYNVDILKKF